MDWSKLFQYFPGFATESRIGLHGFVFIEFYKLLSFASTLNFALGLHWGDPGKEELV